MMSSLQRSTSDPEFSRISSRAKNIEYDGVHENPLRFLADIAVFNPPLRTRLPSEFQTRPTSVNDQIQQCGSSSQRAERLCLLLEELDKFDFVGVPKQSVSSSLPVTRGPDQCTRALVNEQSSSTVPKQTLPSILNCEVAAAPVPCPSGRRM